MGEIRDNLVALVAATFIGGGTLLAVHSNHERSVELAEMEMRFAPNSRVSGTVASHSSYHRGRPKGYTTESLYVIRTPFNLEVTVITPGVPFKIGDIVELELGELDPGYYDKILFGRREPIEVVVPVRRVSNYEIKR